MSILREVREMSQVRHVRDVLPGRVDVAPRTSGAAHGRVPSFTLSVCATPPRTSVSSTWACGR